MCHPEKVFDHQSATCKSWADSDIASDYIHIYRKSSYYEFCDCPEILRIILTQVLAKCLEASISLFCSPRNESLE